MTVKRNLPYVFKVRFDTVMAKIRFFNKTDKKLKQAQQIRDKLQIVNWTKRLISDLTKTLFPKSLIFKYRLIAEAIHYQSPFIELNWSN